MDGPHVLRHVEVEFKTEVEVNSIIMLKTREIDVLALTKKQDHVMKENVQVYIFGSKFLTLWLKIYRYIFISEICTAENTNWSCCSVSQKCDEFQGDCDKDSECKSGLKCGTNNCPTGFPSSYDCCFKPMQQ